MSKGTLPPTTQPTKDRQPLNTNCLQGFCCPACGQSARFRISILTVAVVTDDGVHDTGDMEWDSSSPCTCDECDHSGIVAGFRGEI